MIYIRGVTSRELVLYWNPCFAIVKSHSRSIYVFTEFVIVPNSTISQPEASSLTHPAMKTPVQQVDLNNKRINQQLS